MGGRAAHFIKLYVFKLYTWCFAQVKIAKGTDVANFKCTGGRQILLSNGVLERAFLGAEPGELCLGALAASYGSVPGKACKVLCVRAAIAVASTNDGGLIALSKVGKGMCENRRAFLPCRKAVRHAHGGKCPSSVQLPYSKYAARGAGGDAIMR